ncbi:MAG: HAD family hydrolase [Planctomycetaceae bacterium]|nr:HAD family hydrolase [Planctomycetaceae bacterium]
MPKSLSDYVNWLDERRDLIWPQAPPIQSLKATPSLSPLPDIRLVTFNPYGTLLHIDQGEQFVLHPQKLRTQIALEKTIHEFNMWNSMTRKPGQPWEYMLHQIMKLIEDREMASTGRKGDYPFVDSSRLWLKILERLGKNEYTFDASEYGSLEDLSVKVAYFYHASMQAVAAHEGAVPVLQQLMNQGIRCGLLGDGQSFTLIQVLRCLRQQGNIHSLGEVLSADSIKLAYDCGIRQPSPGLYEQARKQFASLGIEPHQVLHVSHRHMDDLVPARQVGFRTALFVADKTSCKVNNAEVRDAETRPDRLITKLSHLRQLLKL